MLQLAWSQMFMRFVHVLFSLSDFGEEICVSWDGARMCVKLGTKTLRDPPCLTGWSCSRILSQRRMLEKISSYSE